MPQGDFIVEAPPAVETGELHLKLLSKLKLFDGNKLSIDSNTSLLAVSQYYGLVFVGTSNGFLILKTKEVFSVDCPNEYHEKKILLNSKTSHLAISFEQKHLAVGCQTKMGPIVYIYDIGSFLTKGVSPMKTVPLSKPFQNQVIQLCDMMWQPNNFSGLTVCFSDGSVSSLSLFQGSGNDIFSLPNTTQARCLCWSPKGKQIVLGCNDGTLSQYTPDLKFIKKLPAPPFFDGFVSVVNVHWISSFWFAAGYKDINKTEEFPAIVIINAQKNSPLKYVNYDDITYSSTFFRNHQLYFCHLSAWNIILLASANSIEVAVLHGRDDNSVWEQWLLGDASRAELPLTADKLETFPIGLALDFTSDQAIPWGEEFLPPAPRLVLLSSEGLLISFNILNFCKGIPSLNQPSVETLDDSWFTLKEKNDSSLPSEINQSSVGSFVSPTVSLENTKPLQTAEVSINLSTPANTLAHSNLFPSLGSNSFFASHSKEVVFPSQQPQSVSQQPYESYHTSVSSSQDSFKWPQNQSPLFSVNMGASGDRGSGKNFLFKDSQCFKNYDENLNVFNASAPTPKESVNLNERKENVGLLQEPTQIVKFNENTDVRNSSSALPIAGQSAPLSTTPNLTVEQNLSNKNLKTSPSRSAADVMAVSSKIYVTALMDEIDHFDAELKDVLSRVSDLRVHIGTDEEKLNLRSSIEKLNDFEKKLSATTVDQKNEIHSTKGDVIEAFAWLEDARSRNRQRKSRTYIELKKSEDLDPMSNRIMGEISHMKYYIENQLKQLHSYLMKEWMEHENNCRIDIKSMMIVPSMEELYKTMHLELKILNKLRATVEELRQRVTERNMKARSQTNIISDSVGNYTKPAEDTNRMSELYKLADNLLQIKIGRDESDDYINITDAFQLMIKNQINEIVERSKKFTVLKQNILRDTFCEREMMKTRSVKSKFGSSYFIRNSSSKIVSKYLSDSKSNDSRDTMKTGNKESSLESDNAAADIMLQSALEQEKIETATSVDQNKIDTRKIPVSEQSTTSVQANREPSKQVIGFGTPSLPNKSGIGNSIEFTFSRQPTTTPSILSETTKSESKAAPFVFKAAPVFSFGASSPQSQKSRVATSGIGFNTHAVTGSSTSSNSSVFAFKAADSSSTASTSNAFTLSVAKTTSSSLLTRSTSFSSFEGSTPTNEKLVPTVSDMKSTPTSTTIPIFSFSSSTSAPALSTMTTPSSSSSSVFKFTTSTSSGFKFTPSTGSFSFSSPFNSSKTTTESPSFTFSTSPAVSTAFTNVTTSSDTNLPGTDSVTSSSKFGSSFLGTFLNSKGFLDAGKDENQEKAEPGHRLTDQETVSSTSTATDITKTITNITANTTSDITHTVTAVTTSSNTTASEKKIESESGKIEVNERMDENSVISSDITIEKSGDTNSSGKTEVTSTALPAFPQQSEIQVFTGSTALGDTVSSTSSSSSTTATISFGGPGKNIFSQSVSISTTSSIFSTTGSNIFSSAKPVATSAALFSTTAITTAPSSSIFSGTVTTTAGAGPFVPAPATTSTTSSSFVQSSKDEIGKTTALFGDMLSTGMSTGSVFETPSTSVSGNIFGTTSFNKSGSSIFGNAGTTVTSATTASGLFENTSSNIFMKSSFGQMPSSGMTNVFGQPQRENNTFFGQNICSPFGSTTTTTPNQNPFASPTGFNSRPVFGQSLFDQNSSGQSPLERSSTTSIFGNSSSSGQSGGNIFQMGSSSFSSPAPGSFSGAQSTSSATSPFQKPIAGGFGGSPVFGSGLTTTATFGGLPTFGGASTFGSPATFGSSQKIFGSSQGTFGQNQPNFEALANESTVGFADLAQRSQSQSFGGNTFNQNSTFGTESSFGGKSFSSWRS